MKADITFLEDWEICEEVIQGSLLDAETSVDIASANVKHMHVPVSGEYRPLTRIFTDLCGRGVRVRLLHSGIPSGPFLHGLKENELGDEPNFTMRRCPRVHFKTLLVDQRRLYLGSANLTGAGMGAKSGANRNFEIGLTTTDRSLIGNVTSLFSLIWEGKMCEGCGRKTVCYCPLEEPDL